MKSDLSYLTNDSKFLLSSMYKIYLERRKSKTDKKDARFWGNINDTINEIMNEWTWSRYTWYLFWIAIKRLY